MNRIKTKIRYVIRWILHNIVELLYNVTKIDEKHYFVTSRKTVYLCCNKEEDFEELHERVQYRTCVICGEKLDLTEE